MWAARGSRAPALPVSTPSQCTTTSSTSGANSPASTAWPPVKTSAAGTPPTAGEPSEPTLLVLLLVASIPSQCTTASSTWGDFTRTPLASPSVTASAAGTAPLPLGAASGAVTERSEEHTSELQSRLHLVCRLLLEKKKKTNKSTKDESV